MEILVVVRLCCNCTYGEARGAVPNSGARRGAMLRGCWPRGWLSLLGGGRLRRALQPEVGSVFVPDSIESSWLWHTRPRARFPRRAGARAGSGTAKGWDGGGTPCPGCAVGMAGGRGPRLLARGCEHRGAGTPISRRLGSRGAEHPWLRAACVWVPGWWDRAGEEPGASRLCWDSPSRRSPGLCVWL